MEPFLVSGYAEEGGTVDETLLDTACDRVGRRGRAIALPGHSSARSAADLLKRLERHAAGAFTHADGPERLGRLLRLLSRLRTLPSLAVHDGSLPSGQAGASAGNDAPARPPANAEARSAAPLKPGVDDHP